MRGRSLGSIESAIRVAPVNMLRNVEIPTLSHAPLSLPIPLKHKGRCHWVIVGTTIPPLLCRCPPGPLLSGLGTARVCTAARPRLSFSFTFTYDRSDHNPRTLTVFDAKTRTTTYRPATFLRSQESFTGHPPSPSRPTRPLYSRRFKSTPSSLCHFFWSH